ncbi:MAG: VWA domain-containing protein [Anaerolineae bacterium]|nr:VWA domain-containing protein [Anaerolineae bacterium]
MKMRLMRCQYCGLLQDEPAGVKTCVRCGGELVFEVEPPPDERVSYVRVQMELDQVTAPGGRNIDRYLLVTIRTPAQIPPEEAAPTETGRQPLSFTAILDVSGSMRGQKLAQAKEAVRQALRRLHDGDIFSLVTFANEVTCAFEPAEVNDHTCRVVESALQEIGAGGRTALCGGLELGLEKVAARRQETNLVLLLSDGQANVGETDIEAVGQRGYEARQRGIIVSTLGVGGDYNESLMVEIATQGGGRFYHVLDAAQIGAYMAGELGEVASLAARDATLHLTIPAGAALFPLSSAYPAQQAGGEATISLGDIPSDIELEVPIRLTLPAQPAPSKLSVEGSLTYHSPAGNRLSTRLNRVTVRFVEPAAFGKRDGVVVPVAEHVLGQMQATNVLGVSRAMAKSSAEGRRRAGAELSALREYAALLGDEQGSEEVRAQAAMFDELLAAPAVAKGAVFRAHARVRSTRTPNMDKDTSS